MKQLLRISLLLERDLLIGGQAVIEGVMMRTPLAYAVACRKADGSIAHLSCKAPRWADKHKLLSLPIVRGATTLIQSLIIGIKALDFSAKIFDADQKTSEKVDLEKPELEKLQKIGIVISISCAFLFNILLFIIAPLVLTNIIFILAGWAETSVDELRNSHLWQLLTLEVKPHSWLAFNLLDGLLRMLFSLIMIFSMSFMKDIRRVFQYHGAEHKTVFTWEKQKALTVENAKLESRQHPRCGTSFLMVVMLVAIVLFSFIKFNSVILNLLARVVLVPLLAGVSYEVIRHTAKEESSYIFRIITLPGLWLQKITTQEPDNGQLEVAIFALKEALKIETI